MQVFVLVSTGQKVANLPPVLELAEPGDRVVWIESDEARRRKWTDGPRAILEQAGLTTEQVVPVTHVNDPYLVAKALEPLVNSLEGRASTIYLVTNGGTKHTPIGLVVAFQRLSPKLLYGDERPAVLSLYSTDQPASPEISLYTRHRLDLPEILRVNNYTLANRSNHCRIWPDPAPDGILCEQYGLDESYTYRLHADHFKWASINPSQQRISLDRVESLVPEAYRSWTRTLKQFRYADNPQNMENVYYGTLNLAESAKLAAARQASGLSEPPTRIGDSLERAVARRVRAWQEEQQHPAIQSIWMGVKIAREATPQTVEAEFDILVVMKNGVLIHLECKSSQVDARAIDTNTYRLRQAGSVLARGAVVIPLYTRQSRQPWFEMLHEGRAKLEELLGRQNVLLFTIPGQPAEYQVIGEQSSIEKCPSFEEGLDELLKPYRP